MTELPPAAWLLIVAALVLGILAGHFGWGRRWRIPPRRLHPDYLAGLDYLVTEQPDRALDVFLKLMDASADTLETHFALGSLYRRRGEVERAIRIHQNLLARETLAPEHREQALLALAQDYLRAGVLDRAESLFLKVSEAPRLRASALDALRLVYERQNEWQQALDAYRSLQRIRAAPPREVAAHYLCELAAAALARGDTAESRRRLREARGEVDPFPRAAQVRARIAERDGDRPLAARLLRVAIADAPQLLQDELPHLLELTGAAERDGVLAGIAARAESQGPPAEKRLAFAAIGAGLAAAAPLAGLLRRVFREDETLRAMTQADGADTPHTARELGALLAHAERFRCGECGFSGRGFYWHCPACHSWDALEAYTVIRLR